MLPTILPVLVLPVDDGEAEALAAGDDECCVTKDVKVTGARDGFVCVVEGNTGVVVEGVVTGATLIGLVEVEEEVVSLEVVVLEVVTDVVVVGTAG